MFYSKSTGGFYDDLNPSRPQDAVEISYELYSQLIAGQQTGLIITTDENGLPKLATSDEINPPTNADKRKKALNSLLQQYQSDIQTLNIAWLAAAVNDGVNETTKKTAVLTQINLRKTQYSQDVAAVIAQYPN